MAGLALRRLPRELERFVSNPIPGCELSVVGGELRSLPVILKVAVDKPAILEGTVYAGERFELTISCDDGYPFAAPQFKVSSRHIPLHTHIYRCAWACGGACVLSFFTLLHPLTAMASSASRRSMQVVLVGGLPQQISMRASWPSS